MTVFLFRTGTMLVTGTLTGEVRIWSAEGELIHELNQHRDSTRAVKWSKTNQAMDQEYIVSASDDKTTIVWNPQDGTVKQQFKFHTDKVSNVDWQNNEVFASCSCDQTIQAVKIGQNTPVKVI